MGDDETIDNQLEKRYIRMHRAAFDIRWQALMTHMESEMCKNTNKITTRRRLSFLRRCYIYLNLNTSKIITKEPMTILWRASDVTYGRINDHLVACE